MVLGVMEYLALGFGEEFSGGEASYRRDMSVDVLFRV